MERLVTLLVMESRTAKQRQMPEMVSLLTVEESHHR